MDPDLIDEWQEHSTPKSYTTVFTNELLNVTGNFTNNTGNADVDIYYFYGVSYLIIIIIFITILMVLEL